MSVLVLNCGSSSIKSTLFPGKEAPSPRHRVEDRVTDYGAALDRLLDESRRAADAGGGAIRAVGHRVVHGGGDFTRSTRIDRTVLDILRQNVHLAPLHNPLNIKGIEHAMDRLPEAAQVAVFDTAFFRHLPRWAFTYAIPAPVGREQGIRRFGFHGISHEYVSRRAAALCGASREPFRLISCHLGNGCSITAVRAGRAVDTSMGYTPLEGLVMGTRSGDLDPGVVLHLLSGEGAGMEPAAVDELLNRRSGLLGLSGRSSDIRDLLEAREDGDDPAVLALEVFTYRLRKYIGAFHAVLGGVDALVFTAGIGENAPAIRAETLAGLEPLGYVIDPRRNLRTVGEEGEITGPGGSVRIFVIPTDEDRLIYEETVRLLG